jgi:hypothetical protein
MEDVLQQVLAAVIIAVLPILTGVITTTGRNFLNHYIANVQDQQVQTRLSQAVGVIADAVNVTSQTVVETAKKSGKWDAEAQEQALAQTRNLAGTLLNNEVKELIGDVYGDVDAWISAQIESAVYKAKQGLLTVKTETPVGKYE